MVILPVVLPLEGFAHLCEEARGERHQFLDRMTDEWAAGTNRFDGQGELLFGAYAGAQLVGIGGLNVDPYADDTACARLRHVYVAKAYRRQGVGRALVERLTAGAAPRFDRVRLRTSGAPEAASFYETIGFRRAAEPFATHVIDLKRRSTGSAHGRPDALGACA